MKTISIILFTILSLSSASASFYLKKYEKRPKSRSRMKSVITKYRSKNLEKELRGFVKASRPTRMVGSVGHLAARKYLVDRIKAIPGSSSGILLVDEFVPNIPKAIKMYQNDFNSEIVGKFSANDPTFKKWNDFTKSMIGHLKTLKGVKGKNIIWEKKGFLSEKDIIVIGAHYDTIAFDEKTYQIDSKNRQPGADNNATGVSSLIALIEILSQIDLPKTVQIVFFDYQELGFLGSHAFVKKYKDELAKENLFSFVNVLMLGHDTKKYDKEKKYGNMKMYIRKANEPGGKLDYKVASTFSSIANKYSTGAKFEVVHNGFNSGDHVSFWEEGLPAITLTQNWESDFNHKRHHTSGDFPETLNYKTFYKSFKYLASGVLGWAYDLR